MPENTRKSDRLPPWEKEQGGEAIGFGRWLRQQREIREVPLREIADVTKISLRYLEALEQELFDGGLSLPKVSCASTRVMSDWIPMKS